MSPGLADERDRTHVEITAHRRRQKLPFVPLLCDRLGEQRLGLLQMRRELRAEPLDPLIRLFKPRIEILDPRIDLIRREEQRARTEQLELLFQRLLPSSRYDGPRPMRPTRASARRTSTPRRSRALPLQQDARHGTSNASTPALTLAPSQHHGAQCTRPSTAALKKGRQGSAPER